MDAGSRIITTMEAAWRAIQARHPEIPDAVVITGTGNEPRNERWGHHWARRWRLATDQPDRVDELFVAGELLARGGRRIMQTVLHEAAHALAEVRNIKDTSRNGHYHNRRFVALAGEVGLDPPAASSPRGLAGVTLGEATAASYAEVIAALDAASLAFLESPTSDQTTGDAGNGASNGTAGMGAQRGAAGRGGRGRNGTRLAVTCQCDRRLYITPKQYEEAPISCGRCNTPFQAEPDDLDALAIGA
jgi:hypothetical protein